MGNERRNKETKKKESQQRYSFRTLLLEWQTEKQEAAREECRAKAEESSFFQMEIL